LVSSYRNTKSVVPRSRCSKSTAQGALERQVKNGAILSFLCIRPNLHPNPQIGHSHGAGAKSQVHGSIAFYTTLFQQKCDLDWPAVTREAEKYVARLEVTCPRYLDEMRGIAEGAGVGFLDVLALNVRTEIMFGLFTEAEGVRAKGSAVTTNGNGVVNGRQQRPAEGDDFPSDGCTSLSFHPPSSASGASFLAQNWDWQPSQAPNLIIVHISQPATGIPDIAMVTEAGIIGKIGLNSAGVGVCLNAIRARGLDTSRLPVHLALRTILESNSRGEALKTLKKLGGVAGSAHILVADPVSAVGLEFAGGREAIGEIGPDAKGRVVHTNHLVLEHPGVDEPGWLPDSQERIVRMGVLTEGGGEALVAGEKVDFTKVMELFKDEEGFPCSINRLQVKEGESQTLFTIVMDLGRKEALVKVGRPTEGGEEIKLGF
jgi:isopenicillin-N N-acyltransferase-like protein